MPIQPLPPAVAAQIKATSAILSLSDVVLGLLENALDASATRINVSVDFARGGCMVEDDGNGIVPLEFAESGGLAKRFHTDKYGDCDTIGSSGAFLASLAAVSLLTIVSRHRHHRSLNALTIHHARILQRELPAEAHHCLSTAYGTRVTVHNLFGNMPVRVKQRASMSDQVAEQRKQWDTLKRDISRLLLAWNGKASLKVRDAENALIFAFSPSTLASVRQLHKGSTKSFTLHSAHLSRMLGILTQADYVNIDNWRSWIPISASTPALTIKGAVSLEPSPNKHVQFIALGLRALSNDSGHSELYEHVNRIFFRSNFGTVTDDIGNEDDKSSRRTHKRFRNDGYALRRLKTRKGIDRFPMFNLKVRLSETDGREHATSDPLSLTYETSLPAILDLITAMMTQWLSVHHFQPLQPREKTILDLGATTANASSLVTDRSISRFPASQERELGQSEHGSIGREPGLQHQPSRLLPSNKVSHGGPKASGRQAFKYWSRIKTGKAKYFDECLDAEKITHERRPARDRLETELELQPPSVPQGTFATVISASCRNLIGDELCENDSMLSTPESALTVNIEDETMLWADPATKKTCLLNARTGCVVPQASPLLRINGAPAAAIHQRSVQGPSSQLLPQDGPKTAEATPWLNSFLTDWSNPTFETQQEAIRNVSMHDFNDDSYTKNRLQRCSRGTAFEIASIGRADGNMISKADLLSAQVIAQVDRKFILIKVRSDMPNALLLLIDQHAADERIQVERLYVELCQLAPSDFALPHHRSKLGHTSRIVTTILERPIHFDISLQEHIHFTTYAARFAAWGILFDSSTSEPPSSAPPPRSSNPGKGTVPKITCLTITALPSSVSERCKSDPQLLITMLRSSIWFFVESLHLPPLPSSNLTATSTNTPQSHAQQPTWPVELLSAPPPLLELLNSRACRSAIMFNDVLSLSQCEDLVRQLAACVFPFFCAHGRPSLVAICGVGSGIDVQMMSESSAGRSGFSDMSADSDLREGFAEAWSKWKGGNESV